MFHNVCCYHKRLFRSKINMAASLARNESKITLEIRTKSVEQTLVPLVTQVRLCIL